MLDTVQRWLQRHSASSSASPRQSTIEAISGDGTVLIDVRTAREHQSGTLTGTINVPISQLSTWIASAIPDLGRPIQLFCASGSRSEGACRMLRQLGYQNVHNAGGLLVASMRLSLPIKTP